MTATDPRKLLHDALAELDEHVYYGSAGQHPKSLPWDYIVFRKTETERSPGRTGYTDRYAVVIVREEFIPDGFPEQVVEAVEALDGFRLSATPAQVYFLPSGEHNPACETMELEFARARK